MHPYLNVFGIQIPFYWLLGLIGAGFACLLIFMKNKKYKLPADDILNTILIGAVGALLGAKLLYIITMIPSIIEHFDLYMATPSLFLDLLRSGIVYYGGLYGGILAGYIYLKKYKQPLGKYADLLAPGIPVFHLFGRIGCFMSGCCYGVECDFGIAFTESISAPNGIPFFPIQLVEAGLNIIILIILLATEKKRRPGTGLKLYLFMYAVIRFVLEFFRGDEIRGHVWIFSTSQWIALITIVVLCILEIHRKFRPVPAVDGTCANDTTASIPESEAMETVDSPSDTDSESDV